MADSFPRQQARTKNFSLGAPRSFRISPDGSRVVFLRSQGPTDPVTCLWAIDLRVSELGEPTSTERLVADPATISADQGDEPPQERARRERSRERAGGVVAFATDKSCAIATFAVAGQVYATDLGPDGAQPRLIPSAT